MFRKPTKILEGGKFAIRTRNQLRVAIECHKGVKVKVVKTAGRLRGKMKTLKL